MSLWHQSSGTGAFALNLAQGATNFFHADGAATGATTEAWTQIKLRGTYTTKNLQVYCASVNGTGTAVTRKNGANGGNSVSITATGYIEDTSGTTSFADGDLYCISVTAGGSVLSYHKIAGGTFISNTGSAGQVSTQVKFRFAPTLSNLQVSISSNANATSTTLWAQKNGTNTSMAVSVLSSTTGLKEDVSNSVSITAGDLFGCMWDCTTGAGSITFYSLAVKSSGTAYLGGHSSGTNLAAGGFVPVLGNYVSSGSEAFSQMKARTTVVFKNMSANVNSSASITVTLRANTANPTGGPALSLSATGWIEDLTGSYTPAATDVINYGFTGSGSPNVYHIGIQQGLGTAGPTLESFTATLSFTGAFGPTKTFKVFTPALSFVTAQTKKLTKSALTAILSFAGAFARGKFSQRAFTATTFFVGAFSKQAQKVFSPQLNFVANVPTKKIIDSGFIASQSFSGGLTKSLSKKAIAAILSFAGALGISKLFMRSFTATTSFAGVLQKKFLDSGFTATLSFTASQTKKYIAAGFTAALSFSAGLTKIFNKSFAAALSFIGNLARFKFSSRAFTATLSFTGSLTKKIIDSGFIAALSFSAGLTKQARKSFSSAQSFIGNLATSLISGGHLFTQSFTATLSFVGNLSVSKSFLRAFAAVLATSASLSKSTNKVFSATLSFAGTLAKRIARSFTASLSFAGSVVKAYRDAGFSAALSFVGTLAVSKSFLRAFTATLSFAGNLSSSVHHLLTQSFTAVLSFSGALSRVRFINRLFTASLSFAGTLKRVPAKNFQAALTISVALRKQIRKTFSATLRFIGFLFRGGFFEFFAGQKTGSTLHVTVAGSAFTCTNAGSFLSVETEPVTGSTLSIGKTGSNLKMTLAGSSITIVKTDNY